MRICRKTTQLATYRLVYTLYLYSPYYYGPKAKCSYFSVGIFISYLSRILLTDQFMNIMT